VGGPEAGVNNAGVDNAGVDNAGVIVGIVASPGVATDLARGLLPGLAERIGRRLPGVTWTVRYESDALVDRPADLNRLVSAARQRLLRNDWDLVICVTDLPLQTARRPVVAHASGTHGVAVLSVPALGPVAVGRRASEAIVRLVAMLVGGAEDADRRVRELSSRIHSDAHGVGLVAGVVTGNLRLLLGMLRANRPWRLAVRLSRALVTAVAAGTFALVTSDIWRLSAALGPLRLVLLTVGSVAAVVLTIVIGAWLWERVPSGSGAREQVILFNVVTLLTVVIGVLALYLALLALSLVGALVLVPGGPLATAVGHRVGVDGQVALAWLATSLATVGGALGAGLESDEAVREAAYGYQPDRDLATH